MIPLNKTSDNLVLDLILAKNPSSGVDLTKVRYGTPTPNTATGATTNTVLPVTAKKNSGFIGSVSLDYDRLVGEALFRNVTAYINVNTPSSSADLLATLNAQYGLKITTDDIVSDTIAPNTNPPLANPDDPDPVPVDHTITFATNCLAYTGSIPVKIGPKPQVGERLSLVITNTTLDGLQYPDGKSDTKGQAYIYSYGVDCTPIASFLDVQSTGVIANDTAFVTELNKVVPELWVSQATAAGYNLKNATVTYVGSTATQPTANSSYSKILLLKLDETLCTNFTGELYLHYNA